MPTPVPLYATCIENTCGLLMSGVWDECAENPFSCMPITVVQGLLSCMWPAESALGRATVAHSRLLLTSGRLEHFVLPRVQDEEHYATMLRMLSRGCQNLRTLSLLRGTLSYIGGRGWHMDAEEALHELLQKCTKLEHLHSCILFQPNDLWNCRGLKTVRLHVIRDQTEVFCRRITPDLLQRLESVEVFALCKRPTFVSDVDVLLRTTISILDNCPQLTSMGLLESLEALKVLLDRDVRTLGTPRRFQLRRCYWQETLPNDPFREIVLSCPLVEVLVLNVYSSGMFPHLKALKNLTSLHITFEALEIDECDFNSLLDEIGPRLRHLSVCARLFRKPLCLSAVCRNCPNLRSLELNCVETADEGVQSCVSLLNLERLSVTYCHQKGLFFLLTNCLRLKVLCVELCPEVEDGTMQAILRKNPFDELVVAIFDCCSLSESGWRSFVQTASKLSKCCLGSNLLAYPEVMQCVRELNPSAVCYSPEDFSELKEEQFPINDIFSCCL